MMKKILLLTALLLTVVSISLSAVSKTKAQKDTQTFRYEIESAGNGTQGTYLVKVWVYSKTSKVLPDHILRNAVHGVIFKGFTSANGGTSQRPLVTTPGAEKEYEEFFKEFFKSEYAKYAQMTVGTQETIKFGKEYKVGAVVSVQKDQLRKALEQAGVLRKLGAGF